MTMLALRPGQVSLPLMEVRVGMTGEGRQVQVYLLHHPMRLVHLMGTVAQMWLVTATNHRMVLGIHDTPPHTRPTDIMPQHNIHLSNHPTSPHIRTAMQVVIQGTTLMVQA